MIGNSSLNRNVCLILYSLKLLSLATNIAIIATASLPLLSSVSNCYQYTPIEFRRSISIVSHYTKYSTEFLLKSYYIKTNSLLVKC